MPLPKRKHSRTRRDKSRTHQRLSMPTLGECAHCHKPTPAHTVCPHCGYYKGRQVLVIKEKKKKEKT